MFHVRRCLGILRAYYLATHSRVSFSLATRTGVLAGGFHETANDRRDKTAADYFTITTLLGTISLLLPPARRQ